VDPRSGPVQPVPFGVRTTVADQEQMRHVESICPRGPSGLSRKRHRTFAGSPNQLGNMSTARTTAH
jgi:hypothetical protein